MAIIKIKRGLAVSVPALTLEAGELALATDTGKLYVGNGSDKVLINPDGGNATTATKLQTARTIALGADVIGSASFDGSTNVTMDVLLANVATPGTYTKLTVDAKGRVTSATNITAADIPSLTLAKIADAGSAASKNVGVAVGNVVGVESDGKINPTLLPALAISDTFVVATQAAMLTLTAEVGDIAVRTDLAKSFILRVTGAATLANWQELLTPTAAVSSVAGRTGAVTLAASDVGLGNVTNESKITMFTNATLTNPTVTTQATSDNSTKAASTAYVKAQGYLSATDTIDGGTF